MDFKSAVPFSLGLCNKVSTINDLPVMEALKQAACDAIDAAATELQEIAHEIWKHPELNYEEHHAHDLLTRFLEGKGFTVEKKYKLDTAFRAVVGNAGNGPHVAVLCEYDALPEIGHACGHNLIAESGVAAGLGIKAAFEKTGKPLGQLSVIGTPAEEGGGGKVALINKGVFQDVDVAMMLHPAPTDVINSDFMMALSVIGTPAEEGGGGKVVLINKGCFSDVDVAMMLHPGPVDFVDATMLARNQVKVKYFGKASHAAAFPWEGVNALDAAVSCYQMISNLRQQMKPTWRVHGVITNGGVKPNIIPEEAEIEYYLRATKKTELELLTKKCVDCFESAAKATGCRVEMKFNELPYLNVVSNTPLAEAFAKNCKILGAEKHGEETEMPAGGSTDMGNVSQVVPSIHPFFYIGSNALNHTREFTVATGDPKAQSYTLTQSKAMAMSAIDVFTNKDLLENIKTKFREDMKSA